jgi:hypothetical protein
MSLLVVFVSNFCFSLIAVCPRPSGGFVPEVEVMSVLKQRFLW